MPTIRPEQLEVTTGTTDNDTVTTKGYVDESGGASFVGFEAHRSGSVNNVTGDGTPYIVPYDVEDYDEGNNFVTDTFTAPQAGYYAFFLRWKISNITSAHDTIIWNFVTTGETRTFHQMARNFLGSTVRNASTTFKLAQNDTVKTELTIVGSSKTASVSEQTRFSGYLISPV